jgi:hypothetical protein
MSPSGFVRALEAELRQRRVPFELRDLLEYAADVWTMARDNPDVATWAADFLKTRRIVERMREAGRGAGEEGAPLYVHEFPREGE